MKYVSIDIETTGLDPEKHDLIEFGAVVDDLMHPEIPVEELPTFHCYNVKDDYVGSPFALLMHPEIFRRIAMKPEGFRYCYNGKMGKMFYDFLKDHKLYTDEHGKIYINCAGKNFASFDLQFLKRQTDIESSKIKLRHRSIDPGSMLLRPTDDTIPGTEECLTRCKLEPVVAHTAVEDAIAVIRMIRSIFFGQR